MIWYCRLFSSSQQQGKSGGRQGDMILIEHVYILPNLFVLVSISVAFMLLCIYSDALSYLLSRKLIGGEVASLSLED